MGPNEKRNPAKTSKRSLSVPKQVFLEIFSLDILAYLPDLANQTIYQQIHLKGRIGQGYPEQKLTKASLNNENMKQQIYTNLVAKCAWRLSQTM